MKVSIIPREKAPAPFRRGPARGADRLAIEAALVALPPGHVLAIEAGSTREITRLRTTLQNVQRAHDTPLTTWTAGDSLYVAPKDAL